MRHYRAAIGVALAGSLLLLGCSDESSFPGGKRANIAGAASVVDWDSLETISVQELIAAINAQNANPNLSPQNAPATLEDAIASYAQSTRETSPLNNGPWANLRNTLQDRILLASQSRCGFYEEYLKRFQSNSATVFGSLSTILGGAGAIVTGVDGARALAGLAGISSGIGAEMQKDLFAGVTSTVIVPGIEARRAKILSSIITNRCQTPDRYTIMMALQQALQFHSACAMDVGIDESSNAVKQATNPGAAGLASIISLGGQVNQAQSVAVSITKNRKAGNVPSGATVASSITTDTPVQSMLASLTDMSVAPCPTTNGQPAPSAPPPPAPHAAAKPAGPTHAAAPTPPAAPVAPTAPVAPVAPVAPAPPATPTTPG